MCWQLSPPRGRPSGLRSDASCPPGERRQREHTRKGTDWQRNLKGSHCQVLLVLLGGGGSENTHTHKGRHCAAVETQRRGTARHWNPKAKSRTSVDEHMFSHHLPGPRAPARGRKQPGRQRLLLVHQPPCDLGTTRPGMRVSAGVEDAAMSPSKASTSREPPQTSR